MKTKTTPRKKATKGREHTVAKSMPPRRAAKNRPEEPTVELLIDAKGIHSLTAGARPAKGTKATPTAPAQAEVTQQPDDSGDLVVFAFRLSRAERDLIHEAAGSAKASRFVRTLAVAAARGDGPAVLGILDSIQAKQ
jgi:hypothetical protein